MEMRNCEGWLFAALAIFAQFAEGATFDMLSCCPGEDNAREARFVWHSDSDSCLLFCAKASDTIGAHTILPHGKTKKPVAFRSPDVTYYKYEAEISDLEPGTEYVYWVEAGGETSARQKFKSAGRSGSWNFLWMGDVHAHPDDAAKMTSVSTLIANAKSAAGTLDLILFSGDWTKFGGRYDNWQRYNGNPATADYMLAMIPGNKEYYYNGSQPGVNGTSNRIHNKWFLACRNNPPNGADGIESSYWFMRDGVMFVGIDTIAEEGVDMDTSVYNNAFMLQTNWFDRVVSSQRGKFRYLVVFQHYPYFTYSAGDGFKYGDGRYKKWKTLFDKHKVDFALAGDHHNYCRSKALRGDGENAGGTVYVTCPEIGKSLYSPSVKAAESLDSYGVASGDNPTVKTLMATAHNGDESVGAIWFSVSPAKMSMRYIGTSATAYDTCEVTPKNRGWVYEEIGAQAHKRYRFAVDAPRSDGMCMQISEIQLLDEDGNRISSGYTLDWDSTTTDSDGDKYPSNEKPEYAADGKTDTKWLDWRAGLKQSAEVRSAVWLDFCFSSARKISGYRWYTAGDNGKYPSRAPVAWTLSAFDDGDDTQYILDRVTGYDPPRENEALAYPLPESPDDPEEPVGPEESGETIAKGTYYALCVGVNNYENDRQSKLNGCVPDAEDVLSACTNAVKGMWSPKNCHCLCDSEATRTDVRSRFQSIASAAKSGDMVLYYHSSHGGNDCICLYDAEYYADQFAEDLMRFQTGVRVVVVLDTCHSGSMFKGTGEESDSGPWDFAASVQAHMAEMQAVLTKGAKSAAVSGPSVGWVTACDDDQLSVEVNKRGKFTKPFVAAWKDDATDANGDGYNDFKEMFNIAAPKAVDSERAPQTMNERLLKSVAAWSLSGKPYNWDGPEWILESAETPLYTGEWSQSVAYGADGRAYIFNGTFKPYTASTGNVVTVEAKAQFCEDIEDRTPDANAQAAVRLSTNGSFQVWTRAQLGVVSGGVGELSWVDVEAEGVKPVSGDEYTLRTTFDYTAGTYSVEVGGSQLVATATDAINCVPPGTVCFPLATATNRVSAVGFVGDTLFTSLLGNCRKKIKSIIMFLK